MFHFGFTVNDVKRIVWTGVMAFVAVYVAAANGVGAFASFSAAKAAAVAAFPAALAALLSAIKNGVLADGASLK